MRNTSGPQKGTSSRCRTSGNIPGSRLGSRVPLFRRMVDPDLRNSSRPMLRNDTCIRTAVCRLRVELWRVNPPVHAWSSMQLYLFDKERGGGATSSFQDLSKRLAHFTWWQPQVRAARTSSGGFLASTTSVSTVRRTATGGTDHAVGRLGSSSASDAANRGELALHSPSTKSSRDFYSTRFSCRAMDRAVIDTTRVGREDGSSTDVLRFPEAPQRASSPSSSALPLAPSRSSNDILQGCRNSDGLRLGRRPRTLANIICRPAVAQSPDALDPGDKLRRIGRMLDEAEFFVRTHSRACATTRPPVVPPLRAEHRWPTCGSSARACLRYSPWRGVVDAHPCAAVRDTSSLAPTTAGLQIECPRAPGS